MVVSAFCVEAQQQVLASASGAKYVELMPSNRTELASLKNLLSETDLILSTTELPENRTARCRELLKAALALTDDLLSQATQAPAAIIGRKGGTSTAMKGSEYFRQLSAKRKTRAGGRPKSES